MDGTSLDLAGREIGLSIFEEVERNQAMLDAGAALYMTKNAPAEELVEAIRRACARLHTKGAQRRREPVL